MLLKPKSPRNPTAQRLLLYGQLWNLALLGLAGSLAFGSNWLQLPAPLAGLVRLESMGGLLAWSTSTGLFCVGAACVILGSKSKALGWWFAGLCFVLLSVNHAAHLLENLGQLWSFGNLFEQPWTWSLAAFIFCLALVSLRRIWHDLRSRPALSRGMRWSLWMWSLGFLLSAVQAPLVRSQSTFMGLDPALAARFTSVACGLIAPVLCLYCVVSLIEAFERRARLKERAVLQLRGPEVDRRRAA